MAHILIAGHFGCGNLGDDAILLGFIEGLGHGIDVTVMSGAPEETYRMYGLRSIPRMDFKTYEEELRRTDALVFAGGSVFQDSTSQRSVAYYAHLVKKAKKAGKKVYMVGQGVGPLTKFFSSRMAAGAFNMANAIVVRDPSSADTLRSLGVKVSARVASDLAFLLPAPQGTDSVSFAVGDMKTIGIAPRPLGKNRKEMVKVFGDLARLLFQANMMPVLIEMDRNEDGPLIVEISKTQGGKVPDIRKATSPMQIQGRMRRMDAVIAMRLHAGILATTVGVPPFMVSYDPKVAAFAKELGMNGSVSTDGITANRIFENFMVFYKDRERNLRILEKKREELTELAKVNVQVVLDGLGK